MFRLIGANEIIERGVATFSQLRPVLADNASGFNAEGFVGNATLRKDEWEMIDTRVNEVMRERLTIVDDCRARGMVTPVGLGTILRVTERLEEFGEAGVSYDGDTAPQRDRPSFQRDTVPVPVIAKDFQINWRQLEASRTRGDPLDLTAAAAATRRVRDKLQDLFVNGYGQGPDSNTIPGVTTAASRQEVSLATDWDASGAEIIEDTIRMLEAAYAVNLFGPFYIYVPKNYWAVLQEDYSTAKGEKTYMQRILAFEDIAAVRPLDTLSDDNVVMIQMTEDVMDLSEAQSVTTVQWEKNPFVTNFRVLAVAGPHIKSMETADGTTIHGIVHLS
jgi:uncharacterized linocin/CFP29 family protein